MRNRQNSYYDVRSARAVPVHKKNHRHILSSPQHLLDRTIKPIHERLFDFLGKLHQHLSVPGSKPIPSPEGRIISISVTEDNRIGTLNIWRHDLSDAKVQSYKEWMYETLGKPTIVVSENIITLWWTHRPIDADAYIVELAHVITFMGPPSLVVSDATSA